MTISRDFTKAIFEIVPLRNLGIAPADSVFSYIEAALSKVGFEAAPGSATSEELILKISDREKLKEFCSKSLHLDDDERSAYSETLDQWVRISESVSFLKNVDICQWESELVWLASEFFEYLAVSRIRGDLVFCLAATDAERERQDEWMQAADGWITKMGGYLYIPYLPRFICSSALQSVGAGKLARSLFSSRFKALTLFPEDAAVAGDIVVTDDLAGLRDQDKREALSILSSKMLNTDLLAKLLEDESLLDEIEIGRVTPLLIFCGDDCPGALWNHLCVRGKPGMWDEILAELSNTSLHVNWFRYVETANELSRDEALRFAKAQAIKLRQLKDREQALSRALRVLKDKYPQRDELTYLQTKNLHSHIVWTSPEYAAWEAYLQTFLDEPNRKDILSVTSLKNIDWVTLERNRIARVRDADEIVRLAMRDPDAALGMIRKTLETMVSYLHLAKFGTVPTAGLFEAIKSLNASKVFPDFISRGVGYLRLQGNLGVHGDEVSEKGLVSLLPTFVLVMQWFVDEHLM